MEKHPLWWLYSPLVYNLHCTQHCFNFNLKYVDSYRFRTQVVNYTISIRSVPNSQCKDSWFDSRRSMDFWHGVQNGFFIDDVGRPTSFGWGFKPMQLWFTCYITKWLGKSFICIWESSLLLQTISYYSLKSLTTLALNHRESMRSLKFMDTGYNTNRRTKSA